MLTPRSLLLATLAIVPLLLALALEWADRPTVALAWGFASAGLAGLLAAVVSMRSVDTLVGRTARIAWLAAAALALLAWVARSWADLPGIANVDAARWAALAAGSVAAYFAARSGTGARGVVSWVPALVLVVLAAEVGLPAIVDGAPAVRAGGVLDDATTTALCGGVALLVAGLFASSTTALARLSSGAVALVAGLAIGSSGDAEAFTIGIVALVIAKWGRTRRLQDALAITIAVAGAMLGAGVASGGGWPLAIGLAVGLGLVAWDGPRATARTGDDASAAARRGQGIHRVALGAFVLAIVASIVLLVVTRDDAPRPDSRHQDRTSTWEAAVDAWQSKPIFGHGGGGFERHAPSDFVGADARDAHSLALSTAVDLGVLGVALALLALVSAALAARAARGAINDAGPWRAAAVARGTAAALVLQMLIWRTAVEPIAWLALACAIGAAVAPGVLVIVTDYSLDDPSRLPRARWKLAAASLLLAVIAALPLVALSLREQARAGTDSDARRAGRAALDLQPGAAAVRAYGHAASSDQKAGARELEDRLDGDLRHDVPAILAVLDLADQWNDDDLARAAQQRLHDTDRENR